MTSGIGGTNFGMIGRSTRRCKQRQIRSYRASEGHQKGHQKCRSCKVLYGYKRFCLVILQACCKISTDKKKGLKHSRFKPLIHCSFKCLSLITKLQCLQSLAEKGGFEPPRPLFGPAPLAGVCIRPLCHFSAQILCGAAGRIRTHDPLVRSQILYPTELQPRKREVNSILGVCILSRVCEQKIYSLHLSLREAKKSYEVCRKHPVKRVVSPRMRCNRENRVCS